MYPNHKYRLVISPICFFILAFAIAGCCKEECTDPTDRRCPNYDPCLSYVPANADFDILEIPIFSLNCDNTGPKTLELKVDTVFSTIDITFRAHNQADRYYWKIGTDPKIFTDREFELLFGDNAVGDIQVTLVTERNDPNRCSSDPTSRDTVSKKFHILRRSHGPDDAWSLLHGKWRGANTDHLTDSFEIEIPVSFPLFEIRNLPQGCADPTVVVGLDRKNIFIHGGGGLLCKNICGHGALQDDYKTLIINYWIDGNSPGERIQKQFSGTKIE